MSSTSFQSPFCLGDKPSISPLPSLPASPYISANSPLHVFPSLLLRFSFSLSPPPPAGPADSWLRHGGDCFTTLGVGLMGWRRLPWTPRRGGPNERAAMGGWQWYWWWREISKMALPYGDVPLPAVDR